MQLKLAHGWCLPELLPPPTAREPARPGQAISGSGSTRRTAAKPAEAPPHPSSTRPGPNAAAHLSLLGLRPYFLGPTDPAVTNDIEMGNNIWLLTGANMAGEAILASAPQSGPGPLRHAHSCVLSWAHPGTRACVYRCLHAFACALVQSMLFLACADIRVLLPHGPL